MNALPPSALKIMICFSPAGFGLCKDARILADAFSGLGYSVELMEETLDCKRGLFFNIFFAFFRKFNLLYLLRKYQGFRQGKPKTLFLHLENIAYPQLLRDGSHVLIPNQEWFRPTSASLLVYIDCVWCKTQLAQNIFTEFGVKTKFIGFCTSFVDPVEDQAVAKTEGFFSRIGVSALRGVLPLVQAWSCHPEWPSLHMLVHPSRRIFPVPENVIYVDEFPTMHEYQLFARQFRFQIFATETEGFGHAIYEAVESGALVLITDAPPMNEQLTSEAVIKIASGYTGHKGLSPKFSVTQPGIECAVDYALALNEEQISVYQQHGKQLLLKMREKFLQNLRCALNEI